MRWFKRWVNWRREHEHHIDVLILRHLITLERLQLQMANDFTALTTAITDLSTRVDALIAATNVQPQIDSAAAAVTAISAKVEAALPPTTPPPTPGSGPT